MKTATETRFLRFILQLYPAFSARYWAMLILGLGVFQAQAQLEIKADSNHVETGNALQLHLKIPAAMGKPDSLRFFAWGDVLPPQNIVRQTDWTTDGAYFSKTLTALFFDADTIQLPPLPIAFANGDTAYTKPLDLIITETPSPDDLNDMAPIKDIHREETVWTDYLPWILGGLGVLAVIMGLFWLASRSRRSKIQSRSIEILPHELALKKLEALSRKQLIYNGFVKEHYAELTFILREFLEKRFSIPALESTTDETLQYLKNQAFPSEENTALKHLLEQADLAKFAKIIPPESFHTEALETARKIIQLSTPPSNEVPENNP